MEQSNRQQQLDKLRKERLHKFFQDSPLAWQDVKEEIKVCLDNALGKLKSPTCENREYCAGKVNAIEEVLDIENQFKG